MWVATLFGVWSSCRGTWLRRFGGLLLLVLLLALAWVVLDLFDARGGVERVAGSLGPAASGMLVPLQALLSVTPFPGEAVAFVICGLHGFWAGAALVWLGWMLGGFVQYGLARRIARDFELDRARLPGWLQRFPVEHPVFLIVGRWLPGGFHLVNTAAGALKVPLWRHAWSAALGIVPPALLVSALAQGLLGS